MRNSGHSIHLFLGGRRSGKSQRAEEWTLDLAEHPIYLATSRIWDEDHHNRIEIHRQSRSARWETIECEVNLDEVSGIRGRTVLLEDLSLWLTNLFFDCAEDPECTRKKSREILHRFLDLPEIAVIVSSEVGFGIHPETRAGRDFADLLGSLNQEVAAISEKVELIVAGISLPLKDERKKDRGNL